MTTNHLIFKLPIALKLAKSMDPYEFARIYQSEATEDVAFIRVIYKGVTFLWDRWSHEYFGQEGYDPNDGE